MTCQLHSCSDTDVTFVLDSFSAINQGDLYIYIWGLSYYEILISNKRHWIIKSLLKNWYIKMKYVTGRSGLKITIKIIGLKLLNTNGAWINLYKCIKKNLLLYNTQYKSDSNDKINDNKTLT